MFSNLFGRLEICSESRHVLNIILFSAVVAPGRQGRARTHDVQVFFPRAPLESGSLY